MKKLIVIFFMFLPLIFSGTMVLVVSLVNQTPISENIDGLYAGGTINILFLIGFMILSRKNRKLIQSGKEGLALIQSVSNTRIDSSSVIAEFQIGILTKDKHLRSTKLTARLPVKQLDNCQPGYLVSVVYSSENLECMQNFKAEDKETEHSLDAYQAAQYPENLTLSELQNLRVKGASQLVIIKDIQIFSQSEKDVELALTVQFNEDEQVKRKLTCPKRVCSQLIVGKMIDIQTLQYDKELFALRIANSVLTNPNAVQLI